VRTDRTVRKRLRQIQRLPRGGQRAPRAPQDNRDHQHDSRHRVAPRPPRHCRTDRSPHPVTTPRAQAAGRRHLSSRVRGRSSSASKRRRNSLTVRVINVLAVVSASRSVAGVTTRKACSGMARVSRRLRRPHRRQPGPLGTPSTAAVIISAANAGLVANSTVSGTARLAAGLVRTPGFRPIQPPVDHRVRWDRVCQIHCHFRILDPPSGVTVLALDPKVAAPFFTRPASSTTRIA
jgi:hypothetical protein